MPILDDEMFTDRPRRRHVNVAALQAQVDWVNELRGLSVTTLSGKVYKQCVFHRQSASVTDVVSMRVLSNPIRIWQRWRTYDPTQHEGSDVRYCPDEMDY